MTHFTTNLLNLFPTRSLYVTNITGALDRSENGDDMVACVTSPLDQFEIRSLLSVDAPVLGNLSLSLTNIGLYLTVGGYLMFIISLLSDNSNKIVPNA